MEAHDDPSHTAPHDLTPPEPKRLLLFTAGLVLLAGILMLVHLVRPFGRPVQVVNRALEALSAGDAERLRSEPRLGFQHRAEREVKQRGEAEYARVLAIFEREAILGDREYRKLRRKVADLGEREFRKLSRDDQRKLREQSHLKFVADKGWPLLSEEERKLLGGAPEVLADRAKLRARAIAVGLPTLSESAQVDAVGMDLTTPEAAKDRKLGKIAAQAERAGMAELQPALQSADQAAQVELQRLSKRERDQIESGSYARWIIESGLAAGDDKLRASVNLAQLFDDDGAEAWALRRALGKPSLDPESRKQLESLDYDRFVAARHAFIEREGTRLWGEKLREIFNADCCKTGKVRYLGESGRSLLRNATATVALEFGTPPPKPPKAKGAKVDPNQDDDDQIHPARRYLGQTVILEYRWGTWAIARFGAASEDETAAKGREDEMKAALGALSSFGGSFAGFVLFGAIGLVLLLVVVLKRKAGAGFQRAELWAAGAALALAALQIALQGQATLDDLWFTPILLALPIWVGARHGSESGFVAGFLAGLSLVVASAVAAVPTWASAGGDGLLLGEHLLAALMLAGTGALAGRTRWPAERIALPLVWLLFFAVIDRSQLTSATTWAHLFLGAAVTGIGLTVDQLGLLPRLGRSDRPV
jgi:hypothetical protein